MNIGDKVTYINESNHEHGIVKSLCSDKNFVFVVYRCNNDWENYKQYTATRTEIKDLRLGWITYDEFLQKLVSTKGNCLSYDFTCSECPIYYAIKPNPCSPLLALKVAEILLKDASKPEEINILSFI